MPPLIGLAGCGRWGLNILRDLRALGCDVQVCDLHAAAREDALAGGAVMACETAEGLSDDCAGYVVATPTTDHFDRVMVLSGRGRPIFCEKPLTPEASSSRTLATRCAAPVFVMEKWRYHPGVQALADLVRTEELGAVRRIRTRRLQWGHPHTDVDGVWILLPHDLSIVHHILGGLPDPVAAVGDYSGEAMDGLLAILGAAPGPVATVEVSSRAPLGDRQITVSFASGVAWLADPLADHICVYRGQPGKVINPGDHECLPIATDFPLRLELKAFLDYLDGGREPYTAVHTAAAHVEMIERLRDMAAGG